MARTIRINLYKFDELSKEAKKKAVEWAVNANLNTDHEWHEFIIDGFKESKEFFDVENVYYRGFSSQGDGAMFEYSYINKEFVNTIIDGLKLPEWKKRVLKKYTCVSGKGKHSGHYYHEKSVSHYIYIEANNGAQYYDNIQKLIELYENEIEDAIIDKYEDLAKELYRTLEKEYNHLTSEEQLIETIQVNEYEFTQDGKRY